MGRGNLTREEIRILKENPYVEDVNDCRIKYSEEFKLLFVKEYFSGKKPMSIFRDAGFDVKILGNKRIERASARWREANAAGSLGKKFKNNDFYNKNENSKLALERTVKKQQAQIERLQEEIRRLQKELDRQVI